MNEPPQLNMSTPDFLERQIEKALGAGSELQPRLPSLFEPIQEKPIQENGLSPVTLSEDPESDIAVEQEIAGNKQQPRNWLENPPAYAVQVANSAIPEKISTLTSRADLSTPMSLLTSSFRAAQRAPELPSDHKAWITSHSWDTSKGHRAVADDARPPIEVTTPLQPRVAVRATSSTFLPQDNPLKETLIPASMRVNAKLHSESSAFNPYVLQDSRSPVVTEDKLRENDAKDTNQPPPSAVYADRAQQEQGKLQEFERDVAKTKEAHKEVAATVMAQRIVIAPLTAPHQPTHASLKIEPVPADPTPVIHVTIGRIEIRARTGAASPTQTKEIRGPKSMNLDEYLKQRGGKR